MVLLWLHTFSIQQLSAAFFFQVFDLLLLSKRKTKKVAHAEREVQNSAKKKKSEVNATTIGHKKTVSQRWCSEE